MLACTEMKTQLTAQKTRDVHGARLPGTAAAVESVEGQERKVRGTEEVT